MNNLQDLKKILFDQIAALDNPDLTDAEFARQVEKSGAIVKVSSTILNNAKLAFEAQKHFDDYGTGRTVDNPLLGISNQTLMIENKNLRRRLADKESN